MRRTHAVSLATVCLSLVLAATAGAVTTGSVFARYANCSPTGTTAVSIDGGAWSPTYYAGVYNLYIDTTPSRVINAPGYTDATSLVESLSASQGTYADRPAVVCPSFCADVYQEAPPDWTQYNIQSLQDGPLNDSQSPMSAAAAGDLRKLWTNYYYLVQDDPQKDRYAGIFESCVWEIVNEKSGSYKLDDGSFRISNGDYYTDGNNWLNSLSSLPASNANLRILTSTTAQDYAVILPGIGTQSPVVPEPLTLSALALAIGSAGMYARRRMQAKVA